MTRAEHVIVVIGTPIDEHLNPDLGAVDRAINEIAEHLVDGQLLVLRSTVYPGVTAMVERLIARLGADVDVAFCPERIAEGKALEELADLPADRGRPHAPRRRARHQALPQPHRTRSCTSSRRRPSSPSCSPTRGAT